MKKRVAVGKAFDDLNATLEASERSASVDMIEATTRANESATKSNLAYGAIAGGTVFLTVSAGIGVYDGSFDELQSVWNVLGPIVGGIFGHYFGGMGKKNGRENKTE